MLSNQQVPIWKKENQRKRNQNPKLITIIHAIEQTDVRKKYNKSSQKKPLKKINRNQNDFEERFFFCLRERRKKMAKIAIEICKTKNIYKILIVQ